MRKQADGQLVFSPSDLTTYLESPFASFMSRLALEHPKGQAPYERDPEDESAALLAQKGLAHEAAVLAELERELGKATRIPGEGSFESRHAATRAALRAGAPLIFQAALSQGDFQGYADFLVRRPGKSGLGDFHYEAWDSKLAHSAKPYFVIQLCCYTEMLEQLQGVRPEGVTVALGKKEPATGRSSRVRLRVEDYFFYYLSLKDAFLAAQAEFDPAKLPFPAKSEEVRGWSRAADRLRQERDHLSLVANITDLQIRKLEASGLTTLTALAQSQAKSVDRLEQLTFEKLRHQAALQLRSRGRERPVFEILKHDPAARRGLTLLPQASPSDVFFDMEGYPLVEGGLEYLFGAIVVEGGEPVFKDWWAHTRAEEKRAFEGFIDWVTARWKRDPTLHIYHYAAYEVSAMRKLMALHATREEEVDELLRHEVFVDLYTVVSQGIRIGEPRYSLKNVEHIYADKRSGDVTTAGDSIVQYGNWIEAPDGPTCRESQVLRGIRDYNEVDCRSTWQLAAWLRAQQRLSGNAYVPPAGDDTEDEDAPRDLSPAAVLAAEIERTVAHADEAGTASEAVELLGADERVRLFFSHVLQFHRREAKPHWWAYFDRLGMTPEELIGDPDCLGGCRRTRAQPRAEKKSTVVDYEFDPAQETKLKEGSACVLHDRPHLRAQVFSIDAQRGQVSLLFGPGAMKELGTPPERLALIPNDYVSTQVISEAILRAAQAWARTGLRPEALPGQLRDFLYRNPPRIPGRQAGAPITGDGADPLEANVQVVRKLTHGTLCVQGPPGTGKTFTAARMIIQLIRDKKTVGVSANTHEAIKNLLRAVSEAAREQGVPWVGVKIGGEQDDRFTAETGVSLVDKKRIPAGAQVIGGTAWAFSAPELAAKLDTLFVDEAGQVSAANLVAMAQSAENLVLMGDQMQLEQPMKGVHPGETGQSCLTYLLEDHATIPRELGIFLGVTRRMHPDVCQFVSDSIYEGRLKSHPDATRRSLVIPSDARFSKQSGVLYVPVHHEANSQDSPEEARAIQELVQALLKCRIQDGAGPTRPLRLDDILIVAPYNLQVNRLRALLPGARVGTVDKFQGQEAFVSILSMCSSTGEASPRGTEFLFNPNRLNVAISRAQVLSIVVGSPTLAQTRCASLENMRRVNLFCKVVRVGSQSGENGAAPRS